MPRWQSVCSHFDPTDEKEHQMIARIEGPRFRDQGRACSDLETPSSPINRAHLLTHLSNPMDTSEKLMPNNGQAWGKLSRYTSNLGTQHWQAIHRVLKYLKKTMDYRLTYNGYPSVLKGYTDASWISNTEDNSSTSGLGMVVVQFIGL
ncbi:hypothetical protein Tco_1076800, partial [Tanacetum coccineum]